MVDRPGGGRKEDDDAEFDTLFCWITFLIGDD